MFGQLVFTGSALLIMSNPEPNYVESPVNGSIARERKYPRALNQPQSACEPGRMPNQYIHAPLLFIGKV